MTAKEQSFVSKELLKKLKRADEREIAAALSAAEEARLANSSATAAADIDPEESLALAEAAREATFPALQSPEPPPACVTDAYVCASLQIASALLQKEDASSVSSSSSSASAAAAALRAIDLALLRGGVAEYVDLAAPLIERAESLQASSGRTKEEGPARKKAKKAKKGKPLSSADALPAAPPSPPLRSPGPVAREAAKGLSVERFKAEFEGKATPVVVIGAMDDWPALRRWSPLQQLKERCGKRMVPVEFCASSDATSTYLSKSWERRVVAFEEYLENHVLNPAPDASERGYLAQHPLFDQIRTLQSDVRTPSYCGGIGNNGSSNAGEGDEGDDPANNAWLGPRGTISPLHFDPRHNFLCQVVGRKRVTLFSISETPRLYRRGDWLSNNSAVCLDAPDLARFPKLADAVSTQVVLEPGEMLFIPRHCWHHVASLDPSFSVNFFYGPSLEHGK